VSKLNVLSAGVGFETVTAQAPSGVDGQGKPTYAAGSTFKARVVREEKVSRRGDGSEIVTIATLWEDAAQSVLPLEEWRLTLTGGLIGIVVERDERRDISGNLDHVYMRIRRE